jgi:hypothetical protein
MGAMEENPYRAPREQGAESVRATPVPSKVKEAVGAAVPNIALCAGWMIYQACKPIGLSWGQAKTPTLMIALVFAALAVTVWQNRPTR